MVFVLTVVTHGGGCRRGSVWRCRPRIAGSVCGQGWGLATITSCRARRAGSQGLIDWSLGGRRAPGVSDTRGSITEPSPVGRGTASLDDPRFVRIVRDFLCKGMFRRQRDASRPTQTMPGRSTACEGDAPPCGRGPVRVGTKPGGLHTDKAYDVAEPRRWVGAGVGAAASPARASSRRNGSVLGRVVRATYTTECDAGPTGVVGNGAIARLR